MAAGETFWQDSCMSVNQIPLRIRNKYRFAERHHACAILSTDFPEEWRDLLSALDQFVLRREDILLPGGGRSAISKRFDNLLLAKGWQERSFEAHLVVNNQPRTTATHKVDNYRNRIGVEVEWNNKSPFYDRDLNNFRLLHETGLLSVGVIFTRLTELQSIFDKLGKGSAYGASTTHWEKLVDAGGAGGCPLLLIGMGINTYDGARAE
jgi:hypothetical protein